MNEQAIWSIHLNHRWHFIGIHIDTRINQWITCTNVYAVLLYGEIERYIFKSLLPRTKNIQLWFTLFYLYKVRHVHV